MTKLIKVKYDDLTEVAQSAPQAVEFEEIASGSVDLPVSTNKSIFLDSFDQEFKAIDSLGVVSTFGGSAGGLQPVFIDHTGIPAELIRDRIYEADFSGATAGSTLTVTFPEGTGAETFIIGFRITGLSENSSVTFQTTNSQNIFFPDATTDSSLTGVNTPTYLEFAWDQSRYVYGDVYSPTFADLSASLGNVEVDTLTVNTSIIGGEATATQAGTVPLDRWGKIVLAVDETSSITDISTNGNASNSGFKFTGLTVGRVYEISINAFYRLEASNSLIYLTAINNGIAVSRNLVRDAGTLSGVKDFRIGSREIFVANDTTVTFNLTITGTARILAEFDEDPRETSVELRECRNLDPTSVGNDFT